MNTSLINQKEIVLTDLFKDKSKCYKFEILSQSDEECFICMDFIKDNKNLQDYFKYNCPVCFRYFNTILKAKCCENYLCHYCVRNIIISNLFYVKKKE